MTAKIKLNAASGGGSFSLQAPSSSANNRVFTLPDSADATLLTSTSSVGKVLQMQSMSQTARITISSNTNTYYVTGLTLNITPLAASSKILILVQGGYYIIGGTSGAISIFRGGSNLGHSTHGFVSIGAADADQAGFNLHHVDAPSYSVGDALTYDVRAARIGGSNNFYVPVGDPGYATSRITLIEVGA